jgi:hypothetical protein
VLLQPDATYSEAGYHTVVGVRESENVYFGTSAVYRAEDPGMVMLGTNHFGVFFCFDIVTFFLF